MPQLIVDEARLYELKNVLVSITTGITFNSVILLILAREVGVDIPFTIKEINERSWNIIDKIDDCFRGVFGEENAPPRPWRTRRPKHPVYMLSPDADDGDGGKS